jgi:hypothetical protein
VTPNDDAAARTFSQINTPGKMVAVPYLKDSDVAAWKGQLKKRGLSAFFKVARSFQNALTKIICRGTRPGQR